SRRRHTRFSRDWSSDVCSSDLEVGGVLKERKGINLPNTALPIPSMTEKDHADLEWAMAQNVDYIALSFVRKASDCREVKDRIKQIGRASCRERVQMWGVVVVDK